MSQALTAARPLSALAGRYTVHLTQPNPNLPVWRVEVRHAGIAGRLVDELTRSYEHARLARAIYTTLKQALRTPGATVATAKRAVVKLIDAQVDWLLTQPSVVGRVEKADILLNLRAGFTAEEVAS